MRVARKRKDDKTQEMFAEFAQPVAVYTPQYIPQPNGDVLVRPGKPVFVTGTDTVSVQAFAKHFGLSPREIQRLCDTDVLQWTRKTHREASAYRIPRSEIARYEAMRQKGFGRGINHKGTEPQRPEKQES